VAFLENVPPSQLCYIIEGGGLKGKGSPAFAAHRDENDLGRIQCVLALSDGGFDVWPYSHTLPEKEGDIDGSGHFHLSKAFALTLQANCERVVFSARAGDVFIFHGGLTVHGVPEVGDNHPSPRVVTYASYWPPGTTQGNLHAKKRCSCQGPTKC
jgi:hypothetical protein